MFEHITKIVDGIDLLPCPFCGSKKIVYGEYEHTAGTRWGIFCTECLASIDPGWAQQKSIVKEMWNLRNQKGENNNGEKN